MTNLQPWTDIPQAPRPPGRVWDAERFPYVVRWTVSYPDRLTRWIDHTRVFSCPIQAAIAYSLPARCLGKECLRYNGGEPGKHLDRIAASRTPRPRRVRKAAA
jgi:hypothetical protein